MKNKDLKMPYEMAEIGVMKFEQVDIITNSEPTSGGAGGSGAPSKGDVGGSGTWLEP